MDLETRKIAFVQEFLKLQNEEIISDLEKLLHKRNIELYESKLKPMSIEQFHTNINLSLEDSKNGRVTSTEDLLKEIENWK